MTCFAILSNAPISPISSPLLQIPQQVDGRGLTQRCMQSRSASKAAAALLSAGAVVHLVLASVQLTFSGWHVVGSLALKEGADPLIFALYRELVACVFMFAFVYAAGVWDSLRIERQHYLRFVVLGLCSFGNVVGTVIALQYISATRYAILQPSIPVVASIMSTIAGYEKFNMYKVVGIAFAVGGAITVETWTTGNEDDDDSSSNEVLGTLIAVVQCTAMAGLIVGQKPIVHSYHSTVTTAVYYSVGTVATGLACIIMSYTFVAADFVFHSKLLPWLALAYATVFATFYAYNAYSWAVGKTNPTTVTIYVTLQPLFTAILSVIFLNDDVTAAEGVGGLLIAIGLVITAYGNKRAGEAIGETDAEQQDIAYAAILDADDKDIP